MPEASRSNLRLSVVIIVTLFFPPSNCHSGTASCGPEAAGMPASSNLRRKVLYLASSPFLIWGEH